MKLCPNVLRLDAVGGSCAIKLSCLDVVLDLCCGDTSNTHHKSAGQSGLNRATQVKTTSLTRLNVRVTDGSSMMNTTNFTRQLLSASTYARLSRIVIFLFLTFSAAFGQVNGSALVSALTGKTVVPTVELGYTGRWLTL